MTRSPLDSEDDYFGNRFLQSLQIAPDQQASSESDQTQQQQQLIAENENNYNQNDDNYLYYNDADLSDLYPEKIVSDYSPISNLAVLQEYNTDDDQENSIDKNPVAAILKDLPAAVSQHHYMKKADQSLQPELKQELASSTDDGFFVPTVVVCGLVVGTLIIVLSVFIFKTRSKFKSSLQFLPTDLEGKASVDYQELCRQRMNKKQMEDRAAAEAAAASGGAGIVGTLAQRLGSQSEPSPPPFSSTRSSTSSWSEEPVQTNMDISTGHTILTYMEKHLIDKDMLESEWQNLEKYEADLTATTVAHLPENISKNRYSEIVPYDHTRVVLAGSNSNDGSDYINASFICDHDPRNPTYIATQGPMQETIADFWQMVWEQGSVVLVNLTKLSENGETKCARYWPENGSEAYHHYEVHLVSEHIWCTDYLVRSFYLKNLSTHETRTVTQFHFLTWPEDGLPASTKSLLDFRRKVNKSFRGRSCPIVLHCSDGSSRTGTYCLLDMALNRINKGVKEIDIAASLEHLRDQRKKVVRSIDQFEFVLTCIAEEVQAILKALPQ